MHLHLDTTWSLRLTSQLTQSLVASLTDLYVFKLAAKLYGHQIARWALACQLLSWFNAFCLPRTFSNCLEALCTAAAIYYWPGLLPTSFPPTQPAATQHQSKRDQSTASQRSHQHESRPAAVAIAALCVLLRPSSALFWASIGIRELVAGPHPVRFVLLECAPLGLAALGGGMLLDRCFYGRWVVVPWEFFKFNVLQGGSALYGAHPWHWNFTQGFPTIAGPLLPLMLYGCTLHPAGRQLGLWGSLILLIYSIPAHKEFRFLLPALQLLMPGCGAALHRIHSQARTPTTRPTPSTPLPTPNPQPSPLPPPHPSSSPLSTTRHRHQAPPPPTPTTPSPHQHPPHQAPQAAPPPPPAHSRRLWGTFWAASMLLLALNILLAAYFCLLHQRGALAAVRHLDAAAALRPNDTAVLFLMPCHAAPLYSHLHHWVPLHFLDCSPPGYEAAVADLNGLPMEHQGGRRPPGMASESQFFMEQPLQYVQARLPGARLEYSHLVMFDGQAQQLGSWLEGKGCRQEERFFNAHFSNEHDLQRQVVVVACHTPSLAAQQ